MNYFLNENLLPVNFEWGFCKNGMFLSSVLRKLFDFVIFKLLAIFFNFFFVFFSNLWIVRFTLCYYILLFVYLFIFCFTVLVYLSLFLFSFSFLLPYGSFSWLPNNLLSDYLLPSIFCFDFRFFSWSNFSVFFLQIFSDFCLFAKELMANRFRFRSMLDFAHDRSLFNFFSTEWGCFFFLLFYF